LGEQASDSQFDCASVNASTSVDSCVIVVPADAVLHIALQGVETANYTLGISAESTNTGGGGSVLAFEQGVSGDVGQGEYQHYTLPAVDTARSVAITLSGLSGDADLYVRFDQAADNSSYDCKSDSGGTSDEACYVSQERGVVLHIAVHGYAASAYTLTAGAQ
jgi:hypothetical protein